MKTTALLLVILIMVAGCTAPPASETQQIEPAGDTAPAETAGAYIPNPASAFCEEQGYRLEIRTAAGGSQSGACIFPDGSECDEWAFYRGECAPASQATQEPTPVVTEPTEAVDTASDGCKIYQNPEFGYRFHYPADAVVVQNDDPLHGITITGPVVDGESWPAFSISHPHDRSEYRPPENADLLQWLSDHYLLGDQRMADGQISGETAIHLRHDRSPQSPAFERYYFAHRGQLFMILIGHAGDREDWDLYNHFLESFQFDEQAAEMIIASPKIPS
jgi:putative hemolysin